jgi:diadenosine tetraphosphate (Ap4A) HIT family hydrolase
VECALCARVKNASLGNYPFLIHEFEHSFLMLGEYQFYKGFCQLVTKSHHVEMADIASPEREKIFQELMIASKAIQNTFRPKKMNLLSLGNVSEHLHWHLYPRYQEDPAFKNPPWIQMHHFDGVRVGSAERDELIAKLKKEF